MWRPGSGGSQPRAGSAGGDSRSQPRAGSAGSDSSLDSELPVQFPVIFGLQRERSFVGDPWQVDNQAIRQLSGASKRRNLPRLPSATSRLPLSDGRRINSRQVPANNTPPRLESLSRNLKRRETNVSLLNEYAVLPRIPNSDGPSPAGGYADVQTTQEEFDRNDSDLVGSPSQFPSESLGLPREASFSSTLSLNSHGSTIHSSPDLSFTGSERSSRGANTASGASSSLCATRLSTVSPILGDDVGQNRSGSPGTGSNSRSSSPHLPSSFRPRSQVVATRRRFEQERVTHETTERVARVLQGSCHDDISAAPSSQVRLYLSCAGNDMAEEMKHLQEVAFPRLRDFCVALDLDLVITDLHSGPDDDEREEEIQRFHLAEISKCQRSIGPSIAVFVGNRLGGHPLPQTVTQADLSALQVVLGKTSPEDARLLALCYRRDDNCNPPVYVLQMPANRDLPPGEKEEDPWIDTKLRLTTIFSSSAELAHTEGTITDECYLRLRMSVFESEVQNGVLKEKGSGRRNMAYLRDLQGLLDDLDNPEAAKHIDLQVRGERKVPNADAMNLLRDLKEVKIPEVIADTNVHTYTPWWQVYGLEPEHCERNANYLKLLCRHFVSDVKRNTSLGIKHKRNAWRSVDTDTAELYSEVINHLKFAADIGGDYVDVSDNLTVLSDMLMVNSGDPLFIVGPPGCGKSALMAKLSHESTLTEVMLKESVCVVRFIQILTRRPSLLSILRNICQQICAIHKIEILPDFKRRNVYSLVLYFHNLLQDVSQMIAKGAPRKPLVIIIDSVDLLEESENANHIWWLPQRCPADISIVVSMETKNATRLTKDCPNCLKLSCLTKNKPVEFATAVIAATGRTLSSAQMDLLTRTVSDAGDMSPLNATLMARNTLSWRSYEDGLKLYLTPVLKDLVNRTIDEAEKAFGDTLVSHVCGYITIARSGISESELVNALTYDEMLAKRYGLAENIQPLVLIRLWESLKVVLMTTEMGGQTFVSWAHEKIAEVVSTRYPLDTHSKLHATLTTMYIDQIQIYCDIRKRLEEENPGCSQRCIKPAMLVRCFDMMPYHFLKSSLDVAIIKAVYCDLQRLAIRVHVSSVDALVKDLEQLMSRDEQLNVLHSVFIAGPTIHVGYGEETTFDQVMLTLSAFIKGHLSAESCADFSHLSNLLRGCLFLSQTSSYCHLSPVLPYLDRHHKVHHLRIEAETIVIHPINERVLIVTRDPNSDASLIDLRSMMPIRQHGLLSLDADAGTEPPHLVVSQSGSRILTYEGGIVIMQDLQSGDVIKQLNLADDNSKTSVRHLLVNLECTIAIIVRAENTLVTLDLVSGDVKGHFPLPEGMDTKVQKDTLKNRDADNESKSPNAQNEEERIPSVASASKVELTTVTPDVGSVERITDVQLSPDHSKLATTVESTGWSVLLWETKEWTMFTRVIFQSEVCSRIVFSPDSSMLVVGVIPSDHIVVSVENGSKMLPLAGDCQDSGHHMAYPCPPCYCRNGTLLVVKTDEAKAAVFNSESAQRKQTFHTSNPCTSLLFSNDGSFVFIGDSGGIVSCWDVVGGSILWEMDGCLGTIISLFFDVSEGEYFLYTVTSSGCLDAWCLTDILAGVHAKRLKLFTRASHSKRELKHLCAKYETESPETDTLNPELIGSYSKEAISTSVSSRKARLPTTGLECQTFHDVQLSPDGRFIVTAHRQRGVQIWDITTGSLVNTIKCPDVWRITLANEGMSLVCTTYTKNVMFYTLERGRWQMVDRLHNISHLALDDLCISSDTRTLVGTKRVNLPPGKVNIYVIDLVTCHVMAHLLMKVGVETRDMSGLSIVLSHDHAHMVMCLAPENKLDCNMVVCDLYKEISMELPSWARNSPSPLPSARRHAVTPLGLNIEDFGQRGSDQKLSNSKGGLSLGSSSESNGLLFVPNQNVDQVDHTYPPNVAKPMSPKSTNDNEVEIGTSHVYEGITINVIEDRSVTEGMPGTTDQPKVGLLGAGLFTGVQGDKSDAEAMSKHGNSSQCQPISDDEGCKQQAGSEQIIDTADNEELKARDRSEGDDDVEEGVDVKELQDALTKALQSTPSTESDTSNTADATDPTHTVDTIKGITTGNRSSSPVEGSMPRQEKCQSAVMNRLPMQNVDAAENEELEDIDRSEGDNDGEDGEDVKELQDVLSKALRSTPSTESDSSSMEDATDPAYDMATMKGITTGNRTSSPVGESSMPRQEKRLSVVMDRLPVEAILRAIMETEEEEEEDQEESRWEEESEVDSNSEFQDGDDDQDRETKVSKAEGLNDCEAPEYANSQIENSSEDNKETQLTNYENHLQNQDDNSESTYHKGISSESATENGRRSVDGNNPADDTASKETGQEDLLQKSSISEGGFSEVDLSMSQSQTIDSKKRDSIAAVNLKSPGHQSSQRSLSLPFDFNQEPPDDSENPTGRRRDLGHVTRMCRLLVQNPNMTTIALEKKELLIGTRNGNLLVLELTSTIVTRVLCCESLSDNDMQTFIKLETERVGSGEHSLKRPHKGAITHVSRSHDFRYALAASEDKTLSVWDVNEFTYLRHLSGHTDKVTWGEISGDMKMVVSGSVDCSVRLWNLHSGAPLFVLDTCRPVVQTRFSFGDRHVVVRLGSLGLGRVVMLKVHGYP